MSNCKAGEKVCAEDLELLSGCQAHIRHCDVKLAAYQWFPVFRSKLPFLALGVNDYYTAYIQ